MVVHIHIIYIALIICDNVLFMISKSRIIFHFLVQMYRYWRSYTFLYIKYNNRKSFGWVILSQQAPVYKTDSVFIWMFSCYIMCNGVYHSLIFIEDSENMIFMNATHYCNQNIKLISNAATACEKYIAHRPTFDAKGLVYRWNQCYTYMESSY